MLKLVLLLIKNQETVKFCEIKVSENKSCFLYDH